MKHCYEVGITDSVDTLISSYRRRFLGGYSSFKYKICVNINTAPVSDDSCCKPSTGIVSLPVWSAVVNRCEARNMLFTIIISWVDDAIVEQEVDGLSVWLARRSGIPCWTACGIRLLEGSFRQSLKTFLFATYWCIQRIRGFTTMRYISRLFYVLTFLLSALFACEILAFV